MLIYNPQPDQRAAQLPTLGRANSPTRSIAGKLAFAAGETDFQPIVTSVARAYGQAAALTWLEGIKANAGSHVYPDNETIADEVNRGAVAFGVVNQYYWYRMRAELGAANMHSKIAYFAPRDPGYVLDVSGAAVLEVLQAPGRRAEVPRVPRLASRGRRSSPTRSASSTRSPRASRPPRPRRRSTSCSRTRSRSRELGDGSTAIALLREAGLL